MAQFSEFFANHTILVFAFAAILGLLVWSFISGGGPGLSKVSPTDAIRLVNSEDALILDVRGEGEFNEGHVLNATNAPISTFDERAGKLEKYRQKPIIVMCRTGQTSPKACNTLRKQGFEKVYNLSGGLLAWEGANLPLSKR